MPPGSDPRQRRTVRSFVLRAGRLTPAQQRALSELFPKWRVPAGLQPLDFRALFGRTAEVVLEIGFGNGESTRRMALAEPKKNFIGIEVHPPGVGRLLLSIESHGIENVRVAMEDAVPFVEQRVPDASLGQVRIYFPDPWPKKRHYKRRLVQPGFVAMLATKIRPGGLLHVATDWQPYADAMLEILEASPDFENCSTSGPWHPQPDWRPDTKYARRGTRLGHRTRDLLFRRLPGHPGIDPPSARH